MKNILLKYLICLCIALLGGAQTAGAQSGAVMLSPSVVDVQVKSGASHTQEFTVTNNTGGRVSYKTSVTDFWYNEQNKRVNGEPGTLPRSASTWVRLSSAEGFIEPNSSAVVKAVITIPEWASGSYYTVPNFEVKSVAQPMLGEQEFKYAPADAVEIGFKGLMMLTTGDKPEYNVEMMSASVSSPTASSAMEMRLDLHNRGNAHASVGGTFVILNEAGATVGRGEIKEKRYLPNQHSELKSVWAAELPPGKYTFVVTLGYNHVGMEPISAVYELPLNIQ